MTNIRLDEISLVDYPAHQVNGFAVVKSASTEESEALLKALGNRNTEMPTEAEIFAKALTEASIEDITKAFEARADFDEIVKAFPAKKPAKDATKDDEPDEDDLMKSLDPALVAIFKAQSVELETLRKSAEAASQEAAIEKAKRLDAQAIEVAKAEYANLAYDHDVVDPAFRKFAETNPEAGEAISTMLKAVNAQADGAIFKELGSGAPVEKSGAESQLDTIAKSLVDSGAAKNLPEALLKAVKDPANKALVNAYYNGGN